MNKKERKKERLNKALKLKPHVMFLERKKNVVISKNNVI
jgi:hypothetical protein